MDARPNLTIKALDRLDIAVMAREMRAIDRLECAAMSGGLALSDVLEDTFSRARKGRAAYVDGKLVAIYGVGARTVMSDVGTPWLLATDEIDRRAVRRLMVKHSREQAAWLADGFSRFWNLVHADNAVAIRWLRWLGFSFPGKSYIASGERFILFEME